MFLEQLTDLLIDAAGPVGPYRSLMDQLNSRDQALQRMQPEDLEGLFQLSVNRPPRAAGIEEENWLLAIAETAILSARRDAKAYLPKIEPYLSRLEYRLLALQILAGVGNLPLLEGVSALVEQAAELDEEDLLWLLCTLGESAQTGEAEAHLERLNQKIVNPSAEIELGFAAARNRIQSADQPLPTLREIYALLENADARIE